VLRPPVLPGRSRRSVGRRIAALPACTAGFGTVLPVATAARGALDLGTGTDALLAEVGLPPAGPFDQVASRDPGSC